MFTRDRFALVGHDAVDAITETDEARHLATQTELARGQTVGKLAGNLTDAPRGEQSAAGGKFLQVIAEQAPRWSQVSASRKTPTEKGAKKPFDDLR